MTTQWLIKATGGRDSMSAETTKTWTDLKALVSQRLGEESVLAASTAYRMGHRDGLAARWPDRETEKAYVEEVRAGVAYDWAKLVEALGGEGDAK